MRSEKLIRDGYTYCMHHDQHHRQYCSGCALGAPSILDNVMVLFLRNDRNKTLGEAEFYARDGKLHIITYVDVEEYTALILKNKDKPRTIQRLSDAFTKLNTLRGWMYEEWFKERQNVAEEYTNVLAQLRVRFGQMAKETGLRVVED